eukprot:COSAG02_NODE_728_length_17995_cov_52.042244_1_plen_565_part_00
MRLSVRWAVAGQGHVAAFPAVLCCLATATAGAVTVAVADAADGAMSPGAPTADELEGQLERLERLHSLGLISDRVWERRQDSLLDQLLRPATATQPAPSAISFNVKDFGATGDGSTDDSDALQAALTTASKHVATAHMSMWGPSVVFPHGSYAISRTLMISAGVALLGADEAMILQRNSSADIFYSAYVWRFRMERLRLSGGQNHLHLGTNNTDTAFWTIRDCVFSMAANASIRVIGYHEASAGTSSRYYKGSGSTQINIHDSQFFLNEQVAVNNAVMTFADVWISYCGPTNSSNKAIVENHGKLHMVRVLGVPHVIPGMKQRWIDNHAFVTLVDSRFGGEFGGMTIVINYASFVCTPYSNYQGHADGCESRGSMWNGSHWPPNKGPYPVSSTPMTGGIIRIIRCDLFSEGSSANFNGVPGLNGGGFDAMIVLQELPGRLVIRDSLGFLEYPAVPMENVGSTYKLVRVNPALDLDAQLAIAAKYPGMVAIDIDQTNQWLTDEFIGLPPELLPFSLQPVRSESAPTAGSWRQGQRVWARNVTSSGVMGWLCVRDGVPGDWKPIIL